jgi:hypothetical protein
MTGPVVIFEGVRLCLETQIYRYEFSTGSAGIAKNKFTRTEYETI